MALVDTSLQIQTVLVMLAAQSQQPDALTRGDALADKFQSAGIWNVVDMGLYKAKTPDQRLAWWASGAPLKLPLFSGSGGDSNFPQIGGGVLDQAVINAAKAAYEAVYGVIAGADAQSWLDQQLANVPPAPAPASNTGLIVGVIVGGVVLVGGVTAAVVVSRKPRRGKHRAA